MIQALVAEHPSEVTSRVKELLGESRDIEVTEEAATAREVLEKVRRKPWDVVVLDIDLPDRSGLDILRELKQERPNMPVLVLSIRYEDKCAIRALREGAAGYITKESSAQELAGAVHTVAGGGRYVCPALAERLAAAPGPERLPHERLSDREYQVLRMLASGLTVSQAAEEMRLSVKTVSTYRSRILAKMNMRTNEELAYYAARNGIVE
ncbi:MAG TPA: response regulator transcription factor [Candidatus Eisenbacteria bacterium]|nr:response regulator transcription factor [Candidatus Eisenbacteria bacterium]